MRFIIPLAWVFLFSACYVKHSGNEKETGVGSILGGASGGAPKVLAPQGDINDSTPTIRWTAVPGAQNYDAIISSRSDCSNSIRDYIGVRGTEVTVPLLKKLADGNYWVRVTASGQGSKVSSQCVAFAVDTSDPGAFQVDAPSEFTNEQNPSVQWTPSSGAHSYDVFVASDDKCANVLKGPINIKELNYAFGDLGEGTYYACVRAKDRAGNVTLASRKFTVDRTPPGTAIVSVSGTSSGKPRLDWSEPQDAVRYRASVSKNEDCSSPVRGEHQTTERFWQISPALSEGTYWGCVVTEDRAGNTSLGKSKFTIDDSPPATFSILSPIGPTPTKTPKIDWEDSKGAKEYKLGVWGGALCTPPLTFVKDITGVSEYQVSASEALDEKTYSICVQAKDDAGNTTKAQSVSFTVDTTPPAAVQVTAPAAATNDTTPRFQWTASSDANGPVHYQIKVGSGSNCDTVLFENKNVKTLFYDATQELADGTYTARVSPVDAAGNIGAQASRTFEVDTKASGDFNIVKPDADSNEANPTVSWTASDGAVEYEYDVGEGGDCKNPIFSGTTTQTSVNVTTALKEGPKTACVRAVDAAGNKKERSKGFNIDLTPPGSFAISGLQNPLLPDFKVVWGASEGAETYVAALSAAKDCQTSETSQTVTKNEANFTGVAEGEYYVCVTAKDKAGNATFASNHGQVLAQVSIAGALRPRFPDLDPKLIALLLKLPQGTNYSDPNYALEYSFIFLHRGTGLLLKGVYKYFAAAQGEVVTRREFNVSDTGKRVSAASVTAKGAPDSPKGYIEGSFCPSPNSNGACTMSLVDHAKVGNAFVYLGRSGLLLDNKGAKLGQLASLTSIAFSDSIWHRLHRSGIIFLGNDIADSSGFVAVDGLRIPVARKLAIGSGE